ncbi:MAG TPA: DUF4136 domain-containing protein [Chryseolinea sp.]|nr:DUF4136 domain-containing protein [Chryseolinea sp.]
MKTLTTLALLCSTLLFLSCAESIQTFSDHDTKVDLKTYKTYAWVAPGDSVLNAKRKDKLYGGLIVHASDIELGKKGMTVDTSAPDALFMFETQLEDKVAYSQSPTVSVGVGYGGPGYYVGGSAPIAGGQITSSEYQDGMMIMNMYDRKTGNLIWRGGAKKSLDSASDVEEVIQAAVKAIFARLPIANKGK